MAPLSGWQGSPGGTALQSRVFQGGTALPSRVPRRPLLQSEGLKSRSRGGWGCGASPRATPPPCTPQGQCRELKSLCLGLRPEGARPLPVARRGSARKPPECACFLSLRPLGPTNRAHTMRLRVHGVARKCCTERPTPSGIGHTRARLVHSAEIEMRVTSPRHAHQEARQIAALDSTHERTFRDATRL